MLDDVHAKCTSNLTSVGLTSKVCSISASSYSRRRLNTPLVSSAARYALDEKSD